MNKLMPDDSYFIANKFSNDKREQLISAQVSCSNLFDWYIILSLEIYSNLGYTPLSKVLSEQCILNFTFMCLLLCSLKEHPLLDSYRGIYKKDESSLDNPKIKKGHLYC